MSLGRTKLPALHDVVGVVFQIKRNELIRTRLENKKLVLLFGHQAALVLDYATVRHLQRKLFIVLRRLTALNAKQRPRIRWTPKMLERLKKLTLKGYSHKQLARVFKCSTTTVVKTRTRLLGMKRLQQIRWMVNK